AINSLPYRKIVHIWVFKKSDYKIHRVRSFALVKAVTKPPIKNSVFLQTMELASKATMILTQIGGTNTKLGDLRKLAHDIKKDYKRSMELWESKQVFARQLAILIMDKKQLSHAVIDDLVNDMRQHAETEKLQLMDWLMANQLMKDKKTIALIEG